MLKKIMILTFFIALLPLETFADTIVTTSVNNVPIQENYNSPRVITLVPSGTNLTKIGNYGRFYKVSYGNITGWVNMSYTDQAALGNLNANSTFLQVAAQRKNFIIENGYYYECVWRPFPLEDYPNDKRIDCSCYVSDVLYNYGKLRGDSVMMQAGKMTSNAFQGVVDAINANTTSAWTGTVELTQFFGVVPSFDLVRPGDIIVYNGHVEIFAGVQNGQNMVYSCGPDDMREPITPMDGSYVTGILRVR